MKDNIIAILIAFYANELVQRSATYRKRKVQGIVISSLFAIIVLRVSQVQWVSYYLPHLWPLDLTCSLVRQQ